MLYLKFVILFLGGYSCLQLQVPPYLRRSKTIKDCKPLKIQNGRVRTRSRSIFAQFSCNKGFLIAGEKYIKCVKGEWYGTPPVCVKNACKQVTQPRNGFVFETFKGAILNFFCLPGYTLYGYPRVFCDSLTWSGHLPSCLVSNSTPSLTCDFESENLCGWTHDLNHDFDWVRRTFKENVNSSSIQTGPRYDHTLGPDGQGHYMHIEASSRQVNDTSRLISPIYSLAPNKTLPLPDLPPPDAQDPEPDQPPSDSFIVAVSQPQSPPMVICVRLFYHMSGDAMQQLRVYVSPTSAKWDLRPDKALLWISGSYGEGWHKAVLLVGVVEEPFQIIIEGVRGETFASDIAVDDIAIIEDCDYQEETKDSERLTTASTDTIQVESCLNRCYGEKISIESDSFLIACDCDENCVVNNTCCPDFTAICVLGNTEDFATEMSTTELFQLTTEAQIKTSEAQKLIPDVPKPIKFPGDDTEISNNIDPPQKIPITSTITPTTIITKKTAAVTTRKPIITKLRKKVTQLDFSLVSTRPDLLFTIPSSPIKTPNLTNDVDIFQAPIPPKELSKYARITVSNTASKQSSVVPQYLVIVGVVCFALVGIVATAALVKKYVVRRYLGRGNGSHGDSQSDVRFLTSDEILDFTLQRPSDDFNHTI